MVTFAILFVLSAQLKMFLLFYIMVLTNILVAQSIFIAPIPHRIGCPTNKIAPNRRITSAGRGGAEYRTLGHFFDLFADEPAHRPARPPPPHYDAPSNDCDIQSDDNDDNQNDDDVQNDNEAATGTSGSGKHFGGNRFLFNWFGSDNSIQRPQRPQQPSQQPSYGQGVGDTQHSYRPPIKPQYPSYPPARPPYHSGGLLADRPHVPQRPEYPSDFVKPVYEHQPNDRPAAPWRPGLVGGPSAHVVGALPFSNRYPTRPPFRPAQQAPRQYNGGGSILGSFVDLLFK